LPDVAGVRRRLTAAVLLRYAGLCARTVAPGPDLNALGLVEEDNGNVLAVAQPGNWDGVS